MSEVGCRHSHHGNKDQQVTAPRILRPRFQAIWLLSSVPYLCLTNFGKSLWSNWSQVSTSKFSSEGEKTPFLDGDFP